MTQIDFVETETGQTAERPSHFFVSCGMGWAIGDTLEEAAEKMAGMFRQEVKRATLAAQKDGKPGCYFWFCEVLAEKDASYKIEYFMPKGVEIDGAGHAFYTHVTQKEVAFYAFNAKEFA